MAHIKKISDTEKSSKRKKGFISKGSSSKTMKLQDEALEQFGVEKVVLKHALKTALHASMKEKLLEDPNTDSKEVEQPMALEVPVDPPMENGIEDPEEHAEGSLISSDEDSNGEDELDNANEKNDSNESSNENGEEEKLPPFVELYKNGYCLKNNGKDQYYAKDDLGNDYYLVNSSNDAFYAYKTIQVGDTEEKVEFPAVNKDGFIQYIFYQGAPVYPENQTTHNIIWPINSETKEQMYIPYRNGQIRYPANKMGKQFYRKNLNGNDVPINDYSYAQAGDGSEYYPKYANGDEFYLRDPREKNTERVALKKQGDKFVPCYARKANGDEFYPRQYII